MKPARTFDTGWLMKLLPFSRWALSLAVRVRLPFSRQPLAPSALISLSVPLLNVETSPRRAWSIPNWISHRRSSNAGVPFIIVTLQRLQTSYQPDGRRKHGPLQARITDPLARAPGWYGSGGSHAKTAPNSPMGILKSALENSHIGYHARDCNRPALQSTSGSTTPRPPGTRGRCRRGPARHASSSSRLRCASPRPGCRIRAGSYL